MRAICSNVAYRHCVNGICVSSTLYVWVVCAQVLFTACCCVSVICACVSLAVRETVINVQFLCASGCLVRVTYVLHPCATPLCVSLVRVSCAFDRCV